jgi:hypothetical protein
VAQVVEHLPSKCEALSSSTKTKKQQKKKEGKERNVCAPTHHFLLVGCLFGMTMDKGKG